MMIKTQRFPLILNGKRADKALFSLYEEIYFICVTCLFDLGFVLKFKFSFVISISQRNVQQQPNKTTRSHLLYKVFNLIL